MISIHDHQPGCHVILIESPTPSSNQSITSTFVHDDTGVSGVDTQAEFSVRVAHCITTEELKTDLFSDINRFWTTYTESSSS
jgi:hypothetical protein